jgi:REP element-mobilizing transposase RayT
VIFSTKNREPWIRQDIEERIWSYLGGIARENDIKALQIGGIENHVHLLLGVPAGLALSKAVQLIKGGSSKWIKEALPNMAGFGWQDGYAAFTVSKSIVVMWRLTSAHNVSIIDVAPLKRNIVHFWIGTPFNMTSVTFLTARWSARFAVTGCCFSPRLFQASLRDAYPLPSKPWVETHGHHQKVAPRPCCLAGYFFC